MAFEITIDEFYEEFEAQRRVITWCAPILSTITRRNAPAGAGILIGRGWGPTIGRRRTCSTLVARVLTGRGGVGLRTRAGMRGRGAGAARAGLADWNRSRVIQGVFLWIHGTGPGAVDAPRRDSACSGRKMLRDESPSGIQPGGLEAGARFGTPIAESGIQSGRFGDGLAGTASVVVERGDTGSYEPLRARE